MIQYVHCIHCVRDIKRTGLFLCLDIRYDVNSQYKQDAAHEIISSVI